MTPIADLSEEDRAELRRQIFDLPRREAERKRLEAKARRLLRRKAVGLGRIEVKVFRNGYRNGVARYLIVDHIGGLKESPSNVSIEDLIAWLEQQPPRPPLSPEVLAARELHNTRA